MLQGQPARLGVALGQARLGGGGVADDLGQGPRRLGRLDQRRDRLGVAGRDGLVDRVGQEVRRLPGTLQVDSQRGGGGGGVGQRLDLADPAAQERQVGERLVARGQRPLDHRRPAEGRLVAGGGVRELLRGRLRLVVRRVGERPVLAAAARLVGRQYRRAHGRPDPLAVRERLRPLRRTERGLLGEQAAQRRGPPGFKFRRDRRREAGRVVLEHQRQVGLGRRPRLEAVGVAQRLLQVGQRGGALELRAQPHSRRGGLGERGGQWQCVQTRLLQADPRAGDDAVGLGLDRPLQNALAFEVAGDERLLVAQAEFAVASPGGGRVDPRRRAVVGAGEFLRRVPVLLELVGRFERGGRRGLEIAGRRLVKLAVVELARAGAVGPLGAGRQQHRPLGGRPLVGAHPLHVGLDGGHQVEDAERGVVRPARAAEQPASQRVGEHGQAVVGRVPGAGVVAGRQHDRERLDPGDVLGERLVLADRAGEVGGDLAEVGVGQLPAHVEHEHDALRPGRFGEALHHVHDPHRRAVGAAGVQDRLALAVDAAREADVDDDRVGLRVLADGTEPLGVVQGEGPLAAGDRPDRLRVGVALDGVEQSRRAQPAGGVVGNVEAGGGGGVARDGDQPGALSRREEADHDDDADDDGDRAAAEGEELHGARRPARRLGRGLAPVGVRGVRLAGLLAAPARSRVSTRHSRLAFVSPCGPAVRLRRRLVLAFWITVEESTGFRLSARKAARREGRAGEVFGPNVGVTWSWRRTRSRSRCRRRGGC